MLLLKLEDPEATLWGDAITLSDRLFGLAQRQSTQAKDIDATRRTGLVRLFETWCPRLLDSCVELDSTGSVISEAGSYLFNTRQSMEGSLLTKAVTTRITGTPSL